MTNLDLMYGKDYVINDKLVIKNPKLSDVIDLGEETYNRYVDALTMTSISIADILWNKYQIWYEDVDDWKLFLNNFANECNKEVKSKLIHESLKYFTGLDFQLMQKNRQ